MIKNILVFFVTMCFLVTTISASNEDLHAKVEKKIGQYVWPTSTGQTITLEGRGIDIKINNDKQKVKRILKLYDVVNEYNTDGFDTGTQIVWDIIVEISQRYYNLLELSGENESYIINAGNEKGVEVVKYNGEEEVSIGYIENGKEYLNYSNGITHDGFALLENNVDLNNTLILYLWRTDHGLFDGLYELDLNTLTLSGVYEDLYLWTVWDSINYSQEERIFFSYSSDGKDAQEQVELCNFVTNTCSVLLKLGKTETFGGGGEYGRDIRFDIQDNIMNIKYYHNTNSYPREEIGEHTIAI